MHQEWIRKLTQAHCAYRQITDNPYLLNIPAVFLPSILALSAKLLPAPRIGSALPDLDA